MPFRWLRKLFGRERALWEKPREVSYLEKFDPPEVLQLKDRLDLTGQENNGRVQWYRDRNNGQCWKILVADYEFWHMEILTPIDQGETEKTGPT